MNNYRHGDLALIGISSLSKDLQLSNTKTIMTGSNNNPHNINQGKLYLTNDNDFIIGYLIAKDTKLLHKDHGDVVSGKIDREAAIENGIYELRKQFEDTHEGMKQVID